MTRGRYHSYLKITWFLKLVPEERASPHVGLEVFHDKREKLWTPKGIRDPLVEDPLRGNPAPPDGPAENVLHNVPGNYES